MTNDPINKLFGRNYTREKIRFRDNYTCQVCHIKWKEGSRRLDVHHKDCIKEKSRQYDSYEKEKDNLITLCHKCHMNLPEHKQQMQKKQPQNFTMFNVKTHTDLHPFVEKVMKIKKRLVEKKKNKFINRDKKIFTLYQEGKPVKEICRLMGLTDSGVQYILFIKYNQK